ncbi:site-specific integrase [Paenibacillus psychroresistens]|uniref:Site-specific integrase n=1 Tax=Paenibacillus psychroresistens TaxID=1778678 RepID=A0A6B8RHU2_9BACL|nr:site-specific integrase [Paenibacillus psychroresistens]QGQ95810.1 site-specific integrase [Paenibacillus psychroresistens]
MRGHVFQRGKTWSYIIDIPYEPLTGKRRQKKKGGFRLEGEAEAACAAEITRINSGLFIEDSNMTVTTYLNMYLEIHAKPNFKPTSYDTEKTVIEARIIPEIGSTKLQKLTPLIIKKFYAKLRLKYSSDYVRNIHGILRRALRLAYTDYDLLLTNIMDKVKTPKVEKKEMKFWTFEEWNKFIESSEGHVHFIVFSLGVYTGMRRGEILGLRWKDIDLVKGTLTINQTLNWIRTGVIIQPSAKTDNSNRPVVLDRYLIDDLKARKKQVDNLKLKYGKEYENHDLVCCYEYGGRIIPKRITEAFNVLTRKAQLDKIRFHDLRHTYASFLLSIDINPKVAAERMGMSPQMFNHRYSHLLPNMQQDAVNRIEDRIEEARKKRAEPVDK